MTGISGNALDVPAVILFLECYIIAECGTCLDCNCIKICYG